jgi:hypothetical protein
VRKHSGIKRIELDFAGDQIKVFFFLSETRSQQLAVNLRKQAHRGMLVTTLKRLMRRGIAPTLAGLRPKNIRILGGGLTPDQALGGALQRVPETARRSLSRALEGWLLAALASEFKQNAQSFIAATEDPADGISIVFTLTQIPGFGGVREMLKGKTPAPANVDFQNSKPDVKVNVVSGYRRD